MAIASVTKKEVLNAVQTGAAAEGVEMSKADIEKVLAVYTDTLMGSIVYGQRVQMGKLGSFTPVVKKARTARNPKTGESIDVPEKVSVKFSLGAAFAELLNADDAPTMGLLKGE